MRNIFICWSGQRSRTLARALRAHLPKFIPGLVKNPDDTNVFMSDDITKGSRWFDVVEKELERADVGLVCITREGLESGWIHFEAGALARAVRKNKRTQGGTLYVYLLGVRPEELKGPLAEFQATSFDSDDTKKLCAAIVGSMGEEAPLREDWETAFNEHWPSFETEVKKIAPLPASELIPGLEGSLPTEDVQRAARGLHATELDRQVHRGAGDDCRPGGAPPDPEGRQYLPAGSLQRAGGGARWLFDEHGRAAADGNEVCG